MRFYEKVKVWRLHTVRETDEGLTQLFIGTHLVHEVTSPQVTWGINPGQVVGSELLRAGSAIEKTAEQLPYT